MQYINSQVIKFLEYFLVAAISSVLIIRLFLGVTGFPQIGGNGLHIAHMLWGGLLMLVAIIISLCFSDDRSKKFIAIIGGIGFGAFIDEVGKFITSDNNYFFRPAIAIIYIIFMLLFLFTRYLSKGMKQDTINDWDRLKTAKHTTYLNMIVRNKYIARLVIIYFIVRTQFYFFSAALFLINPVIIISGIRIFILVVTLGSIGILVVIGIVNYLRKRRMASFRMFQAANLISLFVFQIFQFVDNQFLALVDLGFSIITYAVINSKIKEEQLKIQHTDTLRISRSKEQ